MRAGVSRPSPAPFLHMVFGHGPLFCVLLILLLAEGGSCWPSLLLSLASRGACFGMFPLDWLGIPGPVRVTKPTARSPTRAYSSSNDSHASQPVHDTGI